MAFILFEPLDLPPAPPETAVTSADYLTFAFAPLTSFTEGYGYPVKIRTFEDQTELRELPGRLVSRELVYDFGRVDSAVAFAVQSFYLAMGGPATPFYARDYANGFTYLCRFDGPVEILRTGNMFILSPMTMAVISDVVDQPDQGEGFGDNGFGGDEGFGT